MNKKPTASLSMDLDNKWSYLKTHGDEAWEAFPSYFDLVVPRSLRFFRDRNLKITVFVVGQDAEREENRVALQSIANAGHEIGNHSYNHEPWLHLYTPEELGIELEKSEMAIEAITGKRTVGFRGPGFSLSDEVLRTLVRRGYEYDCSTFPTYLGPVARAYYFFKSQLSQEQKEERKELFGSWKDGLQSNKPFEWEFCNGHLLEIPGDDDANFQGSHSRELRDVFGDVFQIDRQSLFLDGVEDVPSDESAAVPSCYIHWIFWEPKMTMILSFFPGMNQPAKEKIDLLSDCLDMLTRQFNVVTMRQHAAELKGKSIPHRAVNSAPTGVTGKMA